VRRDGVDIKLTGILLAARDNLSIRYLAHDLRVVAQQRGDDFCVRVEERRCLQWLGGTQLVLFGL